MHSSTTNRTDGNPILEEIKSKERIDKFLEISTTVIVLSASVFLLFVIVASSTEWLPWKINVAHMFGY
jgi:hypothetical protein